MPHLNSLPRHTCHTKQAAIHEPSDRSWLHSPGLAKPTWRARRAELVRGARSRLIPPGGVVGSHTAQMIQGDSGATPRRRMRPGTPWPGQPARSASPNFMAFTEKGTNPGPNVANWGRVPAVECEISIIAYKKFFSSSYRKGSDTNGFLMFFW